MDLGKSNTITIQENANIIQGKGKYLLPGLWDMHVHLTFIPELESRMFPLFIANGITSVRDTGGLIEKVSYWRDKSLHKDSISPRVFIAGPLLDGTNPVYDGSGANFPILSTSISTPEDAERIVKRLAQADVDFIKAYEMLSPETFFALLNAAKKHNLPVSGHIPLSMEAPTVSSSGMKSIEHFRNIELACSAESESLFAERQKLLVDGKKKKGSNLRSYVHNTQRLRALVSQDHVRCDNLLDRFAEDKVWQIPTIHLLAMNKRRLYDDKSWFNTFQYLPQSIRKKWLLDAKYFKKFDKDPVFHKYGLWGLNMIKRMHTKGIKIMPGTDTPAFIITPGFSLHEELALFVEAGLTPLETIRSATLLPAEYFGIDHEIGLIAPGMLADLIVLNRNPLENIQNTKDINAVVSKGRFLDREALDTLLQKQIKN